MVPARASATTPSGPPKPGLRERKKIKTRRAIRRAAYRLFEELGYEATPVGRIAESADVSLSTFFRYFPTKEDIVLTDEYDALLEAGIRARPHDEPVVDSLRHGALTALRELAGQDRTDLRRRGRLIRDVPAIRGRTAEITARDTATISVILAERTGRPADDLHLRVIGAAAVAGLQEALLHWAEDGCTTPLEDLIHQAMDVLARGLTV